MLSYMNTSTGLVVIGPRPGEMIRFSKDHISFLKALHILKNQDSENAESNWLELSQLILNPYQSIINWFSSKVVCQVIDGNIIFDDVSNPSLSSGLDITLWENYISKWIVSGNNPGTFMDALSWLSTKVSLSTLTDSDLSNLCIYYDINLNSFEFCTTALLPEDAEYGDYFRNNTNSGNTKFIVSTSYSLFRSSRDIPSTGKTLMRISNNPQMDYWEDILQQPIIIGLNKTYSCQLSTGDGKWEPDLSFDSLKEARINAKDIIKSGCEAQIINSISGNKVVI